MLDISKHSASETDVVADSAPGTQTSKGAWKRHPFVRAVAGFVLVFLPLPLTMLVLSKMVDRSARIVWPQLLTAAICFLAYRYYVHRIEKRSMVEFSRAGSVRELASGLLLGAFMASSLFAVLAATGAFRVEGYDGVSLEVVRRAATSVLVGLHEEMLMRGIVFGAIEASSGSVIGVSGSAILFGLAHLPSEGVSVMGIVNTIAGGVTLASAYMLTRRLWLPIGMHIAWNFTIGQVFAAVVSGHGAEPGLLRTTLRGPEWLTGGAFGVEGSIIALLLDLAASTLLLFLAAKRGNLIPRPRRERASA